MLKLDVPKLMLRSTGNWDARKNSASRRRSPKAAKSPINQALFLLSKVNAKVVMAAGVVLAVVVILGIAHWVFKNHKPADPLANLQPAVYQPANSGDTLPLPKK